MSKFRKIVETALKRTEYAKMIQYVEYHTAALYNWINNLKFNAFEQNFKTSINGIAIEVSNRAYADLAVYCNENNCHIEDKGAYLESVPNDPPPAPTYDEIRAMVEEAIKQPDNSTIVIEPRSYEELLHIFALDEQFQEDDDTLKHIVEGTSNDN